MRRKIEKVSGGGQEEGASDEEDIQEGVDCRHPQGSQFRV